jgi:hypothetical protein
MRGFQECAICKLTFKETEMEVSHDIPKYLGGVDKDGRHWLCKDCHDAYDLKILSQCFILIYRELLPANLNRKSRIFYMNRIKNEKYHSKIDFYLIAKKIRGETFNESI